MEQHVTLPRWRPHTSVPGTVLTVSEKDKALTAVAWMGLHARWCLGLISQGSNAFFKKEWPCPLQVCDFGLSRVLPTNRSIVSGVRNGRCLKYLERCQLVDCKSCVCSQRCSTEALMSDSGRAILDAVNGVYNGRCILHSGIHQHSCRTCRCRSVSGDRVLLVHLT